MADALLASPQTKDAYIEAIRKTAEAVAASLTDGKAYIGPEPAELGRLIAAHCILPEHGLGFDATLRSVQDTILPNFLRTSSTDYMAHLHGPALLESLSAELILSTFNQSMDSWDQSPVATEVEVAVVRCLTRLFGYDSDADGCFTSGGSQSNLTGILLARDRFCNKRLRHDIKKLGLPKNYADFRLYTSEISHFSMEKSCHLLGLGYSAVQKVPVRADKKMDTDALRRMVASDSAAGRLPFCVVATIGTTDYGSIDDVAEIRQIADEFGLWLHADAAYGGGLVMSRQYRKRMGDLSLCDSITVDFHKMFLLPVSCSAILVKDGADFAPLELHADYLNREEDEEDGYTNLVGKSLQTTRRFDALKVWMAFQTRGMDGYGALIDTCIQNAAYVHKKLLADSAFEPVAEPEISSVVFRVRNGGTAEEEDALNRRVRRALLHRKGIVIGQTLNAGRVCLKFTMLNPLLTRGRLDALLETIKQLAESCRV